MEMSLCLLLLLLAASTIQHQTLSDQDLTLQMLVWTYFKPKVCYRPVLSVVSVHKFHGRKPFTAFPGSPKGTSSRPEGIQYQLIEDVEDLGKYCPGGYHPLRVGDALNHGRYRLIDKLGYGGYSTTWLAQDLQCPRYVAVKVITADASGSTEEASTIRSLQESSDRLGKEIVPPLLDEFWVSGPNGKHRCVVTPPARMSLFDAKESSRFGLFQPKVAQSIIAQLIRGVAFLHSQDTVHGGM